MAVTLRVYVNDDDALMFWSVPTAIAECRGFAIERRRTDPTGTAEEGFLLNRVGFANQPVPAPATDGSRTRPSTEWPFQRFSWTDHDVDLGDTVSYRVIPVVRNAQGALEQLADQASEFSPEVTVGAPVGSRFRPVFNRGFVLSQFMARYLAQRNLTPKQFKDGIQDQDEQVIRTFLSGTLRRTLLNELAQAAADGGGIFAALFELSDRELIDTLCALGPRAHVVLANGSISSARGEPAAEARKRDENSDARAALVAAGVDVGVADRFISPAPLGHNKFLVRTDPAGQPVAAWTGSTNWTPTGLCTQLNNGLLIDDVAIAQVYLDQWQRLRAANSTFPASLTTANTTPTTPAAPAAGEARATVWFSRTKAMVDLAALRAEVAAAQQGILFLMFMPGATGLFPDLMRRAAEPTMYIRGVVSELPRGRGDESEVDVNLVDGTSAQTATFETIAPQGIAHPFATFAAEVTRQQFKAQIGFAIIHSKTLVIDPFSDQPTVITGSHNFSTSASTKNDENFLIVKGDRGLAEAHAVNIMAAYDHYRWRAQLGLTRRPFNGLRDNDRWMAPKLARSQPDLKFWLRQ
jgi:phosphatidylserine/phosphatidylglycerophosphate/cardiolipin synthase-like enzyme